MSERCSCSCGCTRTLVDADDRKFGKCWPCYENARRRTLAGHVRYQAWQAEQVARAFEQDEEEAREEAP